MAYIPSCEDERQFLSSYDASKYKNPAVAADTALFALDGDALKILLIRRAGYPYRGCWALPGGFVELGEDLPKAAARELLEETGLSDVYLEQAFVWGRPDRDPRQRVVTVSYVALADMARLAPRAGDDAAQAEWFAFLDYTAKDEGGTTVASYTLRGPATLRPRVSYPAGRIQQIAAVDSGGLGFDHAESIAYSFKYLQRRVRDGFPAFTDEAEKSRALRALLADQL